MTSQLVLLVVGFLLTTVAGGGLGYLLQTRAWRHQHEVELRDEVRRQATRTFEEVSSLMDRRLYRMRLLWWAARDAAAGGAVTTSLTRALDDYRSVLLVWNDNLNRLLSLVHACFGAGVRHHLDQVVFEEFSAIGRALDECVRRAPTEDAMPPPAMARVGRRLSRLADRVYDLDLSMLALLQADLLGDRAPPAAASAGPGGQVLELGTRGAPVVEVQRALQAAGATGVPADGAFGTATEAAVRSFQASRGLRVDGIVGPRTWAALRGNGGLDQ